MRAAVVNISRAHYNLGAAKLADWLRARGDSVDEYAGDAGLLLEGYDLVALSVIFTWHGPRAAEIAFRLKGKCEVWAGGPGLFGLRNWWREQTGLEPTIGLDARFDKQRGSYQATFASRGCPVNCSFCIVPRIEGLEFSYDREFQPAPYLLDNNLSALPVEYQEHIVRRYLEAGVRLVDANSGFEPRTFDEGTFARWRDLLRGAPWRLALDELGELEDVRRALHILRDVRPRMKQIYVLAGNEPFAACVERAQKVIEWGGEPWVQPVVPLNWLGGRLPAKFDWTEQRLRDFARYFNRRMYRQGVELSDYRPRAGELRPFASPSSFAGAIEVV